jgi:hypothetical protein
VGLAITVSVLGGSAARAGSPVWVTLMGGMNTSRKPAVTRGLQNSVKKIQAYAITSGGAIVNFNFDWLTRQVVTTNLNGQTRKAPAAVEWTNHRQVLVVGNDDASLWRNVSTNEAPFGGWTQVLGPPPGTTICSDPSAASWAADRVDLYVVGCDGTLRHAWTSDGSWAWENQGAPSSGLAFDPGPQVVAPESGRLDVWVKDGGNVLWVNQYAGSRFTWFNSGVPAVTDFAAAPWTGSPGGGVPDTTVAIGLLKGATTMQDANVQTLTVTLTKQGSFDATMYALLTNGRVHRFKIVAQLDASNRLTNPSWADDSRQLYATGKVLNGKIAAIQGFNAGQPSHWLFGFEGSSLVYVTD